MSSQRRRRVRAGGDPRLGRLVGLDVHRLLRRGLQLVTLPVHDLLVTAFNADTAFTYDGEVWTQTSDAGIDLGIVSRARRLTSVWASTAPKAVVGTGT